MNEREQQERIFQLEKLIQDEAHNKAKEMIDEGQTKHNHEKNKIYSEMRKKLDEEWDNKKENEEKEIRTMRSRRNNDARIDVQKKRSDLLNDIEEEVKKGLKEKTKDEKIYQKLLTNLLVQGMVKLYENDIKIACKKEDVRHIKAVTKDAEEEFKKIVKAQTQKDFACKLTLLEGEKDFLNEKDYPLGGVILYCHNGKITCANTLDFRTNLCIKESVPDIRKNLFPSLYKEMKQWINYS